MILSNFKKKISFYDLSLFRICYIISLLFELISPIELLAGWINGIVICWGLIISVHILFRCPEKFDIENKKIIIPFMILGIFTSFVNFTANIIMNIITLLNNFILIFLIFGMGKNTSENKINKEICFILKFIVYFSFLVSILGLYVLVRHVSIDFMGYKLGLIQNRFFGISTNPNQLGFLSVISMFSCDLLNDRYMKEKFKINSWIINFCVTFNIITLFLTDSNASFVFITVYLVTRFFYENFSKYDKFKDIKIVREILFVFMCITVVVSASFLMRVACQKIVNKIIKYRQINSESLNIYDKIFDEEMKIGRGNHEISSGRILLFKQGVQLSKIHPLIGIGRENLSYYGKIYIDGGLAFPCGHPDLHNLYLTLIVSYGWIGFSLFMIFVILVIYKLAYEIFVWTYKPESKFVSKLFAIIMAYFSYANFEIGILSGVTLSDALIWIYLGYALAIVNFNKKELPEKTGSKIYNNY